MGIPAPVTKGWVWGGYGCGSRDPCSSLVVIGISLAIEQYCSYVLLALSIVYSGSKNCPNVW